PCCVAGGPNRVDQQTRLERRRPLNPGGPLRIGNLDILDTRHLGERLLDMTSAGGAGHPFDLQGERFGHECASYFFTVEGKPMSAVAFVSASTLVLLSSKVTTASFFSRLAVALETPGTFESAPFTCMGHVEQLMSGTASVTVCIAKAAPDATARTAVA